MTQVQCKQVQAELHAYRRGELAPRLHQLFEQHVLACSDCRGELEFQSRLEDAAKVGPVPLNDVQKRQVLDGVHRDIARAAQARTLLGRRGFSWWVPLAALAPLAVAVLLLLNPPGAETFVSVGVEGGVTALSNSPDLTHFRLTDAGPRIDVKGGTVLVAFARPAGSGPLRIQTPHGAVVVRGTALRVEVASDTTSVMVQRGWVEAVVGSEVQQVRAGKNVVIDADGVGSPTEAPAEWMAAVREQLPAASRELPSAMRPAQIPSPVPVAVPPATETKTEQGPASGPDRRIRGESVVRGSAEKPAPSAASAKTPEPSVPAIDASVLKNARAAWMRGDADTALSALSKLADTGGGLPPAALSETLRLLSTVEEATARVEEELTAIESRAASADPQAQELALSSAMLLANRLQDFARAQRLVQALLAAPAPTSLSIESQLGRCAVYKEFGSAARARACAAVFVREFPQHVLAERARELMRP